MTPLSRGSAWTLCLLLASGGGGGHLAGQESGTASGSWDSCLLMNGSFEEVVEEELREPGLAWWGSWGVPGWRPVDEYRRGWTSDPDLFTPDRHQNFKGFQRPFHGENYAGFAFGGGRTTMYITEAFGGRLEEPLEPGGRYRVTAHLSLAEENRQGAGDRWNTPSPAVELLFHAPDHSRVPPLVIGDIETSDVDHWIAMDTVVRVPPSAAPGAHRELVFRGYRGRGIAVGYKLAYVYVDAVSVCRVRP